MRLQFSYHIDNTTLGLLDARHLLSSRNWLLNITLMFLATLIVVTVQDLGVSEGSRLLAELRTSEMPHPKVLVLEIKFAWIETRAYPLPSGHVPF